MKPQRSLEKQKNAIVRCRRIEEDAGVFDRCFHGGRRAVSGDPRCNARSQRSNVDLCVLMRLLGMRFLWFRRRVRACYRRRCHRTFQALGRPTTRRGAANQRKSRTTPERRSLTNWYASPLVAPFRRRWKISKIRKYRRQKDMSRRLFTGTSFATHGLSSKPMVTSTTTLDRIRSMCL